MRPGECLPSPVAPQLRGPVLLTQAWADVVFVHWAAEPAAVRRHLPLGTRPDTLDGQTFVGMVALHVTASCLLRSGVPLGGFLQINTRLYSVDTAGRQGVVFLSLDVSRLGVAAGGRIAAGQSFRWSRIQKRHDDSGQISYRCARHVPGTNVTGGLVALPRERLEQPDPLATFLTARWGLHSKHPIGLMWVPVVHEPWQLRRADLLRVDPGLVLAAGVDLPDPEPVSVLFSPGLVGKVGRPSRA